MQSIPKIVLEPSTVHVWNCSFKKNRKNLSEYLKLLSSDEKQRSGRFKFEKDRNCFIITRATLRLLLSIYLKKDAKEIRFDYTSYGKPKLATSEKLKFNVSHSVDMAAFAFIEGQEIGVDIEKIKKDFNVLELAQSFFSKTEITALHKLPKEDLERAFFRCWTRKESFIKAEGSGLSFPLNQFAVSVDSDNTALLLETKWNEDEKNEWSLRSFQPAKGYIAAIAVKQQVDNVVYRSCSDFSF